MVSKCYEGITFEGGDGKGKDSLNRNVTMKLVEQGHTVVSTNYPQYFGFGRYIRLMNRGGADPLLKQLTPYQQLQHRGAMYALDRALSLIPLLRFKQQFPHAINVSDRGPDSNANTLGYMISLYPELREHADTFVAEMQTMDGHFRQTVQTQKILCMFDPESIAQQGFYREQLDQLERPDAQTESDKIYQQLLPEAIFYTKRQGDWVDRDILTTEALERTNFMNKHTNGNGLQIVLGPKEYAGSIFAPETARLAELDQQWRCIALDPNDPDGTRKARLDKLETAISNVIEDHFYEENFSCAIPIEASNAVNHLLQAYPYLLTVIETLGSPFYATLFQHIALLQTEN